MRPPRSAQDWLVPLDSGRDDDLEYEMTPLERQQEATDWITWVMAYKQYPPYVAYQKGLDFRNHKEQRR